MTPQRWISNLLEIAEAIADRRMQEERWRNGTWNIWEHPDELINTVDDCVLDGFIEAFTTMFTTNQELAIRKFQDALERFCLASPQSLNPVEVLVDPQWELIRQSADGFIAAFKGCWPGDVLMEEANRLLQEWMKAYSEKSKK